MKDMTNEQKAQYKEKLIQLLKKFNTFCSENNLTYYAGYGTVIGAVRHKGLIPWDDDIDVYMPRKDYERFKNLQTKANKFDCRIEKYENKGFNAMFSKFVDSTTTLWELDIHPYVIGVYIDVFPLDECNNDAVQILELQKKLKRHFWGYLRIHYGTSFSNICNSLKRRDWHSAFGYLCSILTTGFNEEKNYHIFAKTEKSLAENKDGEMLVSLLGPYGAKELYKKEWFAEQLWVEYEEIIIPIPSGYDDYLKQLYGDYMQFPPIEKRVSHHVHTYVNFEKKMNIKEINKVNDEN